ncbi:MAG TPA: competence/damage-inducible protein A [Acidobacteriaceae bacterium]|nr:competence/damage-inducible protein A [Acidobacteriaceae bacterium]
MIAEIIAAGSEMLTPFRQDTNSLYLTARLNELGVQVAFKTIVGDDLAHLTDAAKVAIGRADVVIFSGGLGPTEDDLTREGVAAALGLRLRRNNDVLAAMYKRFAARRVTMPENNAKQADVLDGAELLENATGSAPGQYIDTVVGRHRKIIVLLPGPPKELKAMYESECAPRLKATLPERSLATRMVRMALVPESQVDKRTAPIYKTYRDVQTTILAGSGEIQLHFVCAKPSREEAQARVDELVERIEAEMAEAIFSSHGETLEEMVLLMLGLRHLSLAVAESCTGGLVAQRLTSIPGASRYFLGGAVVYADALKMEFTDVPAEMIANDGPVSKAVAKAMAEGIRRRTGADVGLAVTGIAGPGPGEPGPDADKPIGLVYVAISFSDEKKTRVTELNISGDRDRIRLWASQHALELLRRGLLERG